MEVLENILKALNIPEPARLVYVDLVEHGASSARMLSARLSLTRPSVYDQLKILKRRGLVVEREVDGKTEFLIGDVEDLERLLKEEKGRLESLTAELKAVQNRLVAKTAKGSGTEPRIKFISGREGILRSMHDMLWDEALTLRVVWPYRAMLKTLGEAALSDFNQKRIRNHIRLETIWSQGDPLSSHLWEGAGDWGVERRRAPQGVNPPMGYTIYDHKVLFVSSAAEAFGFVVQSRDFANLMRLQFDLLWKAAKPEKKSAEKIVQKKGLRAPLSE